ncbi:MAG TPA: HipA family kinase [Burkholderiales bacterium]|nr:HipA family kinase [Burkholderiales bacterium]
MSLIIVEVLERSIQGRTQPYVCRGDDGEVYFVKGAASATSMGLIAEWLCASLANSFGLPIAPYTIATVPDELIEADLKGWLKDLGAGKVFASRRVEAVELTEVHRDLISEAQRRDVLVFDWWVRNCDRNLTDKGGNPNLLWNPRNDGSLVVIDHNLAFDPGFSAADFVQLHVFSSEISNLFSDFLAREAYVERMTEALGIWPQACDNVPESWLFVDAEQTIPINFSLTDIKEQLNKASSESFWELPP